MRVLPGSTLLSADWTVGIETGKTADSIAALQLVDEARERLGRTWTIGPGRRGAPRITLRSLVPAPSAPELFRSQGYRLTVEPGGIEIAGATPQGRFYGVQTLRQLVRGAPSGRLPCLAITDHPGLEWRGISDDVSRGQISTLEDFRRIVRQLAYYKLDLYQPYIEDMFAFEASPRTGLGRAPMTRAELAALIQEGRRNHVTVAPIFETLGHQERLLALPENRVFAASGPGDAVRDALLRPVVDRLARWERETLPRLRAGRTGLRVRLAEALLPALAWAESLLDTAGPEGASSFAPQRPGTRVFVEELIDEIGAAGHSPFFHVGGDEYRTADSDPASDRIGARGREKIGAAYLAGLDRHIRSRWNRETMVYADAILSSPAAAASLPRQVVVVDWQYDPADSFASVATLERAGFTRILVSAGLWNWRTFYPNYGRAFENIARSAEAGRRHRVLGTVTASWGDGGAESLRENNWTGYAYAAAASWEPAAPARDEFLERYVAVHYGPGAGELARVERLLGWQPFDDQGWFGRLYHRRAIVRTMGARWLARMTRLEADMVAARRAIAACRSGVAVNREHLDDLDHCAARFLFVARRELALHRIALELGGRPARALRADERADVVRALRGLRDESERLTVEYAWLWRRCNRLPMLGENVARMRAESAELRRLATRAAGGSLAAWSPGAEGR
jgi:hypothetical protein